MGEVILGAWKHRSRSQKQTYCIEGKSLSMEQIAAELGVTVPTARGRYNKARALPGKVTWDQLRR